MKKNPSYTALLRPTRLLISENLPPTQLNGPTRLFGRLEYAYLFRNLAHSTFFWDTLYFNLPMTE